MKIGEYEIDDGDHLRINAVLSDFMGYTCKVLDGIAAGTGRSVKEDKQYRLNINNQNFASVKLKYDANTSHLAEYVVNEVRDMLAIGNYKVKRISGFPINGDKWRGGDCLLIDWGTRNRRIDLDSLNPSSLNEDELEKLFDEVAKNGAFAYALGLWDRDNRNFVWDNADKKIISIDHEVFSRQEVDQEISAGIANVMTKFFDVNWYEKEDLETRFKEKFSGMWYAIAEIKSEIEKIFQKHGYQARSLIPRINKGPGIPLSLIMLPAIYR